MFILYHNCVAVLIYQLFPATSHRSFTKIQVKMNLTFMRHGNALPSQFLCKMVQSSKQHNSGILWTELYWHVNIVILVFCVKIIKGQIKNIVWLYSSGQKKIGSVGRIFFLIVFFLIRPCGSRQVTDNV